METIVDAAIMFRGEMYIGRRHVLIIKEIRDKTGCRTSRGQGFITNTNRFVGRGEARKIAIDAGQVQEENLNTGYLIFSEDLWEYNVEILENQNETP